MKAIDKYFYGNLFTDETNQILSKIQPIIDQHCKRYSLHFYAELMSDQVAARFLNNDLVETRLTSSMQNWIRDTLAPKTAEDIQSSIRDHHQVGEVHSRIEIPMQLVDSGMTILKEEIFRTLIKSPLSDNDTVEAVVLVNKIMDAASSLINESYLRGKVSNEKTSQEFRSSSSAHETALEIERVKNHLFIWMNRKIIESISDRDSLKQSLYSHDFGLWIKHKYPLICTDSERLRKVEDTFEMAEAARISLTLAEDNIDEYLNNFSDCLHELTWLLTDEANRGLDQEAKLDPLMNLLDRRFLNPILQQETKLAIRENSSFSLIMIDLDKFKSINDTYGHHAGDKVLSIFGRIVKEQIRITDYAFRVGGEEILVLVPEMELEPATKLAERIRHRVEEEVIHLQNNTSFKVTASFGVAMFDGHPDYQRVLNRADEKLYQAKNDGRNCVKF